MNAFKRGRGVRSNQAGLTLIELIFALVIIGLGALTLTTVVVSAFNASRSTTEFGEDVRAAESCYETILAIHETNQWERDEDDGPQAPWDENRCGTCDTPNCTTDWVEDIFGNNPDFGDWVESDAESALEDGCPADQGPNVECRGLRIEDRPAVQFRITIRGNNHLELVIPIDEPEDEENNGDGNDNGENGNNGGSS